MDRGALIRAALEAREAGYTPYSHFKVGAALLAADGSVWRGCNIENAGFSATNCAERTAFFKAISEGRHDFQAIAVVGGPEGPVKEICSPCGVCRQVMAEFCDLDAFRVILAADETHYEEYSLREILPLAFVPGLF